MPPFYAGQKDYIYWLNQLWDMLFGDGVDEIILNDGIAEPGTLASKAQIYVDEADTTLKVKHGDGTVVSLESGGGGGYTDEEAQDAVGGILVDSATIDFTYDDATPSITADVVNASITTAKLADANVTTAKLADANVTTAKVADAAITYAKVQDVSATSRLLGRASAGAGPIEEITLGSGLAMSGGALVASVGADAISRLASAQRFGAL